MTATVVNLAVWAEPTTKLVALCNQAIELFAAPNARSDKRLGPLTADLDVVLNQLQNLPPLPGVFGRAVTVIGRIHAHSNDDVLDALGTLARLATIATTPIDTTPRPAEINKPKPQSQPANGPKRRRNRNRPANTTSSTETIASPTLPGFES